MKSWLQDNNIEIYSTNNEGKNVFAERFIRTLKTGIYRYMTSVSKNVCIDKFDNIVNKYNNTYHSTIKTKPVDVKWSTYINLNKENKKEDPKLKVGGHVRKSNMKVFFLKITLPINLKKFSWFKKLKILCPHVITDLNGEEISGSPNEKELPKANQKKFRAEKVIKKKGDKLYVKWKGYDNFFNS